MRRDSGNLRRRGQKHRAGGKRPTGAGLLYRFSKTFFEKKNVFFMRRTCCESQISLSTAVGLFESVINMILVLSVNWISRKVTDSSLF